MRLKPGEKSKYRREIDKHRKLYKKKNLKYVRNNWVFYWRFLSYLEDMSYRPETIKKYYSMIKHFLTWLNKKYLRKVRKNDLEDYLLYLRDIKEYTLYTLRYYKGNIGVFFDFVMRYTRIKINPVANLNIRLHFRQPEKMDFFYQEEVELILNKPLQVLKRIKPDDYVTAYSYQGAKYKMMLHYLIFKLLFSTGIRPFELVHIELKDIDFEMLKIRIENKGNQQYIMENRNVFITEKTGEQIKSLIKVQKSFRSERSKNRLFIHYWGWKLGTQYPNNIMQYWAERCGIRKKVYAYMARYTYCTRLVENGIDPHSLRKLMGHKQLEVTLKHYLKLTKTELKKEWKAFNPLNRELV